MNDVDIRNQVVVGLSGELFLASESRKTIGYLSGVEKVRSSSVRNFADNYASRLGFSSDLGAVYKHLVAPDKHHVYAERFPLPIKFSFAEHFRENAKVDFLYPVEYLRSFLPRRVYKRTDTHWTEFGTAAVSVLIASQFGVIPDHECPDEIERLADLVSVTSSMSPGDLGDKLEPADGEAKEIFEPAWSYQVFGNGLAAGNDGAMRVIYSASPRAKGKLLIFGDSYMLNSLLCLSRFFREILFCRTRYYHREIALPSMPDFILTENVERYFGLVHSDKEAPPFLLTPALLSRATTISEEAARAFSFFMSDHNPRFGGDLLVK